MGLITCPECGRKNVSEFAEACPGCGYNINKIYAHREKRKYISLGTVTIKADDITSFELKNASKEFLYPIEKLEAIISSKTKEVSEHRYKGKEEHDYAVRYQSKSALVRGNLEYSAAEQLENEIVYYKHKYENLVNKINHFSKKYELAKADQLFVLSIKTTHDNFKYYNASAPFDINKKYEELVSLMN